MRRRDFFSRSRKEGSVRTRTGSRLVTFQTSLYNSFSRRVFWFFLSETGRDASRGYQLSRQMRVDSAGIDSLSLIELRSCEVPGFLFSLKSSSCPRASPPRQYTAFLHLESHVPRIRHLSPGVTHRHYSDVQQSRSFQSFRSSGWASRTAFRPHRQA